MCTIKILDPATAVHYATLDIYLSRKPHGNSRYVTVQYLLVIHLLDLRHKCRSSSLGISVGWSLTLSRYIALIVH